MAQFGFAPAVSSNDHSGLNTDNEIFSRPVSVPENARCQSILINMGRFTAGNVNVQFCLWDASTHGLIVASAVTAVGSGLGNKTIGIADTVLLAGRSVYIGFWRDPSLDAIWAVGASGSFNFAPLSGGAAGPSNPISVNACTGPFVCGDLIAVVNYIPILTWKGVAGIWKRDLATVGRAGAWGNPVPVKVGRAGVWNQIG